MKQAEGEHVLLESYNPKKLPRKCNWSFQINYTYFSFHSRYAHKIQHMFNSNYHGRNSTSWFRLGNKKRNRKQQMQRIISERIIGHSSPIYPCFSLQIKIFLILEANWNGSFNFTQNTWFSIQIAIQINSFKRYVNIYSVEGFFPKSARRFWSNIAAL